MAQTIFFQKELNGIVTIRKCVNQNIIYALQPTQNLSLDPANSNCILIKSAVSSFDDRGIVIRCADIDSWACRPVIYTLWETEEGGTRYPTPNDCLQALLRDYFFCGCHPNSLHMNTFPPISVGT